MSTSTLAELRRYVRIGVVVAEYWNMPRWTATEAAMLVCGIAPPRDCRVIEGPVLMLGENEFASDEQLRIARHVLSRWTEDYRDEQGVIQSRATRVRPGFCRPSLVLLCQ